MRRRGSDVTSPSGPANLPSPSSRWLPQEDLHVLQETEVDHGVDDHLLLEGAGGHLGPTHPPDRDLGGEHALLEAAGDDRLLLVHLGLQGHQVDGERDEIVRRR